MRAKTISLAALAALSVTGCGDSEPQTATTVTVALPSTTSTSGSTMEAPPAGEPPGPAESATEDPRVNAVERRAGRTARRYIEALDARDGAAVCAVLAPGALDRIELPHPRGDCAASLEASIGYRDPRGLPVWSGVRVTGTRVAELDAGSAKVVVSVVTTFADRDEKSFEDDIVYLVRDGEAWLVAKPSATLYRSVGIGDIPPSVISPPS
jgi:hypothetical protein